MIYFLLCLDRDLSEIAKKTIDNRTVFCDSSKPLSRERRILIFKFLSDEWQKTTFSVRIKVMEEKNEALKFAMKLIGLRRRSIFEIRERLEKKKFEENIIEEVLQELKSYKYLDDEQFAESYINDRMNFRPCGRFLIKKELSEKGITENIIERKIEELINEEIEIESAKKLAQKKLRTINDKTDKNKADQKVKSYLQSRGYSFDIISRAVIE